VPPSYPSGVAQDLGRLGPPSTFESYERKMINHVIGHIDATQITKIDAGVLNRLYATLQTRGGKTSLESGRAPGLK
jgi:hypothetical protein